VTGRAKTRSVAAARPFTAARAPSAAPAAAATVPLEGDRLANAARPRVLCLPLLWETLADDSEKQKL
jgi:hypothetical protein